MPPAARSAAALAVLALLAGCGTAASNSPPAPPVAVCPPDPPAGSGFICAPPPPHWYCAYGPRILGWGTGWLGRHLVDADDEAILVALKKKVVDTCPG